MDDKVRIDREIVVIINRKVLSIVYNTEISLLFKIENMQHE